jgi:hypothetical protein
MRTQIHGRSLRWSSLFILGSVGFWGCGDQERTVRGLGGWPAPPTGLPEACSVPLEGCPCEGEGESVECGETVTREGDRVICTVGHRTCEGGLWSACSSSRTKERSVHGRVLGLRPLGEGTRGACPDDYENVECDPYCNAQIDEPDAELDVPPNFDVTEDGLTIVQTGTDGCNSIALEASDTELTVTSLSPLVIAEGENVALRVTPTPENCLAAPFPTKYTVDQPDRARTTGATNQDGAVELRSAVAGPLVVTAYAGGRSASVTLNVRVRVVDTVGVAPDIAGTSFRGFFYGNDGQPITGTTASSAVWLYPYARTHFPLGLLPPVVQYKYTTADTSASNTTAAVRLSLRYPAGSSYADAAFDYALVLTETNSVHRGIGKAAANDPQIVVPPRAWDAFEETARGNDATLVVERRRGNGTLEAPATRNIHFVNGQLKGSVLYNSYNSTIAGSQTDDVIGGVLRILPGEEEPTVAVEQTEGKCTVCHSVSSDGSRMVLASGDPQNGSGCNGAHQGNVSSENYRGNSCSFDLDGAFPFELETFEKTGVNQYTFAWSGLYPNGSFALTNAWNNMGSDTGDRFLGSPNAPPGRGYRGASKLVRVADGRWLESRGAPAMAVTPAFSHDGRKVAFNQSQMTRRRDVVLSEIAPCQRFAQGLVISEVSACRTFGDQSGESVEIRNDSAASVSLTGYTIRGGSNGTTDCSSQWTASTCATTTLAPGQSTTCTRVAGTECLPNGGGRVQLYNGSTPVAISLTPPYAGCSSSSPRRAILTCSGGWLNEGGAANESDNDWCEATSESLEIRNDTGQRVNIGGWSVEVGQNSCLYLPEDVSLDIGEVWKGNTISNCLPNSGSATVMLYSGSGDLVDSYRYTNTCTPGAPTHPYLDCEGTWRTTSDASNTDNDNCALSNYTGDAAGNELAVMDFECGAGDDAVACDEDAPKTFSNRRTIATHSKPVGYPSFLPDNDGLVFHRVVNEANFSNESTMNSVYGGAGEVWLTSTTNSEYAPVRLNALNGYNGDGTGFMNDTVPRDVGTIPNYDEDWHSPTPKAVQWHYDQCFSTAKGTATVAEAQLNYFPTASPQEAGDKYWVLFTSRRLYGNVAVSSPWQAERSNNAANRFGAYNSGTCENALGPGSGLLETKKLWVAAVDKDWRSRPEEDPSHPAFYLPGQELQAGNSHAYWVATPCAEQNAACETDDDCCGGTGEAPDSECRITDTTPSVVRRCQPIDACSNEDQECSDTTPCCTGLVCPAAGGVCQLEAQSAYTAQTYEREFVAECPAGMHPVWLEFEWQATIEAGTRIEFRIRTRPDDASPYEPSVGLFLAAAETTTLENEWDSGEDTVDEVLVANEFASQEYLLVSMTFEPDENGDRAPTLHNWRQIYDCIPSE